MSRNWGWVLRNASGFSPAGTTVMNISRWYLKVVVLIQHALRRFCVLPSHTLTWGLFEPQTTDQNVNLCFFRHFLTHSRTLSCDSVMEKHSVTNESCDESLLPGEVLPVIDPIFTQYMNPDFTAVTCFNDLEEAFQSKLERSSCPDTRRPCLFWCSASIWGWVDVWDFPNLFPLHESIFGEKQTHSCRLHMPYPLLEMGLLWVQMWGAELGDYSPGLGCWEYPGNTKIQPSKEILTDRDTDLGF